MLGNALDNLDATLYDSWTKETKGLVELVSNGLDKMKLPTPVPDEIKIINDALATLKKANISREQYVNAMKVLADQLGILASKKDFNNNDVNNFFFLSHRCAVYLNGSLLTEYNKYLEAYMNPTGKALPKHEPGFFERKGVQKIASDFSSYMLQDYQKEIQSLLVLNVQRLQANPAQITTQPITLSTQPNILEAKLGKDKYQSTQSQVGIDSISDVSIYLKEQIYGASFEFYYMQIATLYGLISKVENVAIGTPEEIAKERQKLLDEAGFGELNSNEAREYLNKVALKLGFDDAKDLYDNYVSLDTDPGVQNYIQYKNRFVEYANKDIPANQDPLNEIKDLVQNENTRIKNKAERPFYNQGNANYIKVISYSSNELLSGIKNAQRIANVAKLAADDAQEMMGENLGFWGTVGMYAANWQKHRIDGFALSTLNSGGALLLAKMNEDAQSINKVWIARTNERIKQRRERRDEIIVKAANDIDGSTLVKEYIDATIAYKKAFQEYNKAQNLDKTSPEYAHIRDLFKKEEEKYNNYKDAFSLCANDNIFKLKPSNISDSIKQRDQKIKDLEKAYKQKVDELGELKDEINAQTKSRNTTLLGRFAKWRDNAAAFFGITTKSRKEIDDKQQRYNQLTTELEPLGLELQVQMELLARTKKLQLEFEASSKLAPTELLSAVSKNLLEVQQTYETIKSLFESDKEKTSTIFNEQEKLRTALNSLSILADELTAKFNNKNDPSLLAISLLDLEKIRQEVISAKAQISNFDPVISGITKPLNVDFDGVITNLSNVIEVKKIAAQNISLENAKRLVSEAYKDASLEKFTDPFSYALKLPGLNLSDLNSNSREALEQHIMKEATTLFARTSESLSISQLESIYLSLQAQSNSLANKKDKNQHDSNLQIHYQTLADSAKEKITAKVQHSMNRSLAELREDLPKFISNIIHYKSQSDASNKSTQKMESIVDSWIWNGFGLITREKIDTAKAQGQASSQLFEIYSAALASNLSTMLGKTRDAFEAFDYDDLQKFIKEITAMRDELAAVNISDPTTSALDKILEAAIQAERSHTRHVEKAIHREISDIDAQLVRLNKMKQEIDSQVTVKSQANVALILEYNALLSTIKSAIEKTQHSLRELNDKRALLGPKYKALGVTTFEEDNLIIIYNKKLSDINATISKNTKDVEQYAFFATITEGKTPTNLNSITKTNLGKGLLMALSHQNIDAANILLNSQNTKEHIDVFTLSSALPMAVKIGNLDLVIKIMGYNTAVFSQDTLNSAFRAALTNNQDEIVKYIAFKTDFMPDNETMRLIVNLMPDKSSILEIDRGFLQVFGDNDGVTLNEMRKGYIFLEQLASSIQDDLSLLSQVQEKDVTDDVKKNINIALAKIAKLESLKDAFKEQYANLYFQTPERRAQHIQKWNTQIDQALARCHKMIQNILDPKVTEVALAPTSIIERAKEEIARANDVVAQIDEELAKRSAITQASQINSMNDKGVIFPVMDTTSTQPDVVAPDVEASSNKAIDSAIAHKSFENEIDAILKSAYISQKQLGNFSSLLKQYIHEVSDDKERLSLFLQKLFYQLAKEQKGEALTILIEASKNYVSQDVLANALSQAIQANNETNAKLLIEHHAFEGHENEILQMILEKLEKSDRSAITERILFEFLTHAKDAILVDPHTQKLNSKIIEFVSSQVDSKHQSKIPATSKGGWFRDNDLPKLEQVRKAYLFAEQALKKLEMDVYINHLQKMLEINNRLDTASPMELAMLEKELALLEENYETQLNSICKLVNLAKEQLDDTDFDNLPRKEQNLSNWDDAFSDLLIKHKRGFDKDIKNAKNSLQDCKAEISKQATSHQDKRQSAVLSMQQTQAINNGLDAAKKDPDLARVPPKPPKI